MDRLEYVGTQTFQLVISSLQTFGPAFKAQEEPQTGPPATSHLGKGTKREEDDVPRASKRAPIVCAQTNAGEGGEIGAVSASGSKSADTEQKTAAQGATPGPATRRSTRKNGTMQDVVMGKANPSSSSF